MLYQLKKYAMISVNITHTYRYIMAFNNAKLQKLLNQGKIKTLLSYGGNTGLRAKKLANRISFQVNKRVKGGKNTSTIVGYYPDISLKEALAKAHTIRTDADGGLNPKLEKIKRKSVVTKGLKTLEGCIQEHIMDKESARTTPIPANTIRQTWSAFRLCSPNLLLKPIAEITPNELRECFNFMSSSQYKNRNGTFGARRQAEIWMSYTKAVFRMAYEIKDYIDVNPCPKAFYKITREIKSYDHFLQPSEVSAMISLINDMEDYPESFIHADVVEARLTQYQAVKLTVLTGLRNASELYTIKWTDVKLGGNKPTFNYTTSKQQQPLEIPITPMMSEVFKAQQKRRCNSYVFPSTVNSKKKDDYIKGVWKAMQRLRELLASSSNLKQFQNSKVFNNLMLRHTFTTLGNRIGIPIEKLDAMSGHIQTTQRKVATTQYISRIAEDMREDFIKLHEFMLAGKDFEDTGMSEQTIQLKHNSLVARLNSPRGRQSKLTYFNENYPATYLGQATKILKVSKHHYTRFYERLIDGTKDYEPVLEFTGYLVELPKFIVKSLPEFIRRGFYTFVTEKELSNSRTEAMQLGDIAEQEMNEHNTYGEDTQTFQMQMKVQEIREELGDTYKNSDYYKKMPKDKLAKIKTQHVDRWISMAKAIRDGSAKVEGSGIDKFIEKALQDPEEKWKLVYERGSQDFNVHSLDEDRYSDRNFEPIMRAIDRSPNDPLAQKALQKLLSLQKVHLVRKEVTKRTKITKSVIKK